MVRLVVLGQTCDLLAVLFDHVQFVDDLGLPRNQLILKAHKLAVTDFGQVGRGGIGLDRVDALGGVSALQDADPSRNSERLV